jgi:hypothetical protein
MMDDGKRRRRRGRRRICVACGQMGDRLRAKVSQDN